MIRIPIPKTEETNVMVIPAIKDANKSDKDNPYKKVRVAVYARVSTDSEEQQSSYESQVTYYTQKIQENKNWILQGVYTDDGISGTSTKNRLGFQRLIKNCTQDKIDLVITKSISRFSRNTVDTLKFYRILKEKKIAVIFEKEHINTLNMDNEMILTVLSMLAQTESESQSKNVSMGIRMAFKAGKTTFLRPIYGYRKEQNGKFTIVPEEAKIVDQIYREYLHGKSLQTIATELNEQHIPTLEGKTEWNHTTIRSILVNEKYTGDVLLQKTFTTDCLTKKRVKNEGQHPMYLVQNHHEPIISRDVYNRVKEEMALRTCKRKASTKGTTLQGKYSSKYALNDLLICGECGTPYRRCTWTMRNGEKRIVWRCINRIENGRNYCHDSPTLDEDAIQNTILKTLNNNMKQIYDLLPKAKESLEEALQGDAYEEINTIRKQIEFVKEERAKLVELNCQKEITDDFETEFKQKTKEIQELMKLLKEAEENTAIPDFITSEIDELMNQLQKGKLQMTEFKDNYIRQIITGIKVIDKDHLKISTVGGFETTCTIEK